MFSIGSPLSQTNAKNSNTSLKAINTELDVERKNELKGTNLTKFLYVSAL